MKYGVNTIVWTNRVDEGCASLFTKIKKWGFDGVEIFISPDEPADPARIRKMLDAAGLELTTGTVIPRNANLVSPDAATRAYGIEFLKKCLDRTAEMGARLICGPMHASLGLMTGARRTQQEWDWVVESLSEVAQYAEDLEISVCIEPLNRFETYFLNTQADAARLVKDVGSKYVRIHFDTFHANIEEKNPAESLRSIAKALGHVHISENDRGIPGTGHTDWKAVLSVLNQIGYDGWLTIESFAKPEPSLAAAAAIWRDVVPSGDALAKQGIKFLKQVAAELDDERRIASQAKKRKASTTKKKASRKR